MLLRSRGVSVALLRAYEAPLSAHTYMPKNCPCKLTYSGLNSVAERDAC